MTSLPADLPHLSRCGPARHEEGFVTCLALAHNEANIIGSFLEHYRSLGPVSFVIVDDHSTDGTRAFLEAQPDVTIYQPKPGSTYARDKRAWRSEILDACADGRWCLVPDIDEHLVWRGMANTSLPELIGALEEEGAEALLCIMVDMYADRPLTEHVFPGGTLADLRRAFPLFDRLEGGNYRTVMFSSKFLAQYPTPPRWVTGGMIERVFQHDASIPARLARRLMQRHAGLSGAHVASGGMFLTNYIVRQATRWAVPHNALNLTKLALLRWRRGMQFYGGAHSVNRPLQLSERRAVLLHYRFTRGIDGIRYIVERGQHAKGGGYYGQYLGKESIIRRSLASEASSRFRGASSLGGLVR